jgi:hypothetical protein
MIPSRSRSDSPWSERACEGLCLVFGLWTIVCNLVIWRKGSLVDLAVAEGATFGLALVAWIVFRVIRQRKNTPSEEATPPSSKAQPAVPPDAPRLVQIRIAALVLTLLGLGAYPFLSRILVFWWLGMAALFLGLLALALDRWQLDMPQPHRSRVWEAGLWGLALAAVVFNLTVHRPDPDDALYVNVAASSADQPDLPLMDRDEMQGIEGLPFHSPVYLTNSIEPLWGMLSRFTGIRAQLWFHVVHAALGAFFIILAYAVLLRLLVPERWLLALILLLIVLLGTGGPLNHWYGNLAFVRVWQGKCTFLNVFLPLTFAYGMRFGMRPSMVGWVLLATAQISAVGMSSSAIWVEPLAGGIGLLCGALGRGWAGWRRVVVGCFASAWVIAVGLHLKSLIRGSAERILRDDFRLRSYDAMAGYRDVLDRPGEALDWAWTNVMGEGPLLYLCLGAILIGWTVGRHSLARRFAVLSPLLTLAFVMNPYIEKLVMANLTGPVYHRSSWLLPIPLFITLLFLSPLDLDPKRVPRKMVVLFMIVGVMGYVTRVSPFTTVDERNRIYYGAPGVKIHPEVLESLEQAVERLPAGAYVIAPTQVSFWFPTFHHRLYPVTVHALYTYKRSSFITRDEADWRVALTEYVAGEARQEDAPGRLREGVDHFGIQGVIVDLHNQWRDEVESVLADARFQAVEPPSADARYQLWTRPADDPGVRDASRWKIMELR